MYGAAVLHTGERAHGLLKLLECLYGAVALCGTVVVFVSSCTACSSSILINVGSVWVASNDCFTVPQGPLSQLHSHLTRIARAVSWLLCSRHMPCMAHLLACSHAQLQGVTKNGCNWHFINLNNCSDVATSIICVT
jgi:hypothetical protein